MIDGRIYQEQVRSGFLSVPSNIYFQLSADGMKIFRSAVKSSIWPMGLCINELPYKKRILPRNIVLAGLWFGKKPPNPNLFLKPLYKSMKVMSTTGYNFKLHDNSEIISNGIFFVLLLIYLPELSSCHLSSSMEKKVARDV